MFLYKNASAGDLASALAADSAGPGSPREGIGQIYALQVLPIKVSGQIAERRFAECHFAECISPNVILPMCFLPTCKKVEMLNDEMRFADMPF